MIKKRVKRDSRYQPCAELNTKNSTRWQLNVSEQATQSKNLSKTKQATKQSEQVKSIPLNFDGGLSFSSKARNLGSKAEHANISSPPIIFMGGPSGSPHKNGGEESLAEYPS